MTSKLSTGNWIALIAIVVTVGLGAFRIGYMIGRDSVPPTALPVLQWGNEDGCGFGFTEVLMPARPEPPDTPDPLLCRQLSPTE